MALICPYRIYDMFRVCWVMTFNTVSIQYGNVIVWWVLILRLHVSLGIILSLTLAPLLELVHV